MGLSYDLIIKERLPHAKVRNLLWIRKAQLEPDAVEAYPCFYEEHQSRMVHDLAATIFSGSLVDYCTNYDRRCSVDTGTGMRVARMLLANRALSMDLNNPSPERAPLASFQLSAVPDASVLWEGPDMSVTYLRNDVVAARDGSLYRILHIEVWDRAQGSTCALTGRAWLIHLTEPLALPFEVPLDKLHTEYKARSPEPTVQQEKPRTYFSRKQKPSDAPPQRQASRSASKPTSEFPLL